MSSRWDDWAPQDRLRAITPENIELAKMLKAEVQNMNKQARPNKAETAVKKRASSARASENSPAPGGPAPQIVSKKRGRDLETEKVTIKPNNIKPSKLVLT